MKKEGSFNFTLFLLFTAAFASLIGIAYSGQSALRAVYRPVSPQGEHALISGPFPSDWNSNPVVALPQRAVGNGFPQPSHYSYAHCLVKASIGDLLGRGASEGNGVPDSGHRIVVYTRSRSLLLYGGRKLLAAYPVALGRDNAWLDGSNNGAPIELAGRT